MVFDKLVEIFSNVIPEVDTAEITKDSSLMEDLGLNSLTMMLLAVSVEDEFDIKFEDMQNLETVGDVCDYITQNAHIE